MVGVNAPQLNSHQSSDTMWETRDKGKEFERKHDNKFLMFGSFYSQEHSIYIVTSGMSYTSVFTSKSNPFTQSI